MAESNIPQKTDEELAKELGVPIVEWNKVLAKPRISMDKDWRPKDWNAIKQNIIAQAQTTWSPSKGYSPDQKEQLVETTASVIIEAILKEQADGK